MSKRRAPSAKRSSRGPSQGSAETAPYSSTLKTGFQATTTRVQEMHHAIAAKTFDTLARVPGVSVPANWVRGAHDAITDTVYAAVRGGGGLALSATGVAESALSDPARVPQGAELQLRSALNAVAGDALSASGSPLALDMAWFAGAAADVPLSAAALGALGPRAVVFIHGLACNEQSWLRGASPHYGAMLQRELDLSPLWLRYNTGLAIDANGQQLAVELDRLALAAPQVRQWLLIGHSMGGLVARSAVDRAAAAGSTWLDRCPMLICLGTPHQGAALEKIGHLVSGGLSLSKVTQPLAHIADTRSRGVRDLRHGRAGVLASDTKPVPMPALRFIAGSLGDAAGKPLARAIDRAIGDGLVRADSAADAGHAGDVLRVRLPGIHHMALLNHPKVYAVMRDWLAALPPLPPLPPLAS